MNIMSLQGSPRKEGNTAKVLGWIEDELRSEGHAVEHVDVCDLEIRPCDECFYCQRTTDTPGCKSEDKANSLFRRMIVADLIIFASPVFCWGFTAQMKTLLDRSICLCKVSDSGDPRFLMEGQRAALVATAGGPVEGNMDLILEVFNRYTEYLRCKSAGDLRIPRCSRPDELDEYVEKQARDFAKELAAV